MSNYFSDINYELIFNSIYNNNYWKGRESRSGPGSDFENASNLIRELPFLFKKFNIRTILDIPCGDFNWFRYINLNDINYTGADIVYSIIENNNKKYQCQNVNFVHMDIIESKLPCVDLLICRDCFIHFPNRAINQTLKNMKDSQSKFLLTTSHNWRGLVNNKEINFGDWRRINLEEEPFNFPPPIYSILEGSFRSVDSDRFLGLWKISDLP